MNMYTCVIIDDERLIQQGTAKKIEPLKDIISCVGFADNGEEALSLIADTNPDIIITDMNMPIMDGTQLLPILTEQYPSKPLIVISGYKDFEYMKHAISAKAIDYILKPFSKEILQEAVLSAIKQLAMNTSIQSQMISSKEQQELACYDYDVQLLTDVILGYHKQEFQLSSERLGFINKTHNLVLITIHSNPAIDKKLLQEFLSENSFGDLALFLQHTHNQQMGFLILFLPEQLAMNIATLCKQVIQSLVQLFFETKIDVLFGVSHKHSSLLDLHTAFSETVMALNSRLISSSENTHFFSSSLPEPRNFYWPSFDEFLFRLETGEQTSITNLLNDLFDIFEEQSNYTIYDIKFYCFWLSTQATALINDYFEQIASGSGSTSMKNILDTIFTLAELKIYYLQFFQNIANILKEKSIYSIEDTIEKIKIYVNKHYSRTLTIEFLSSLFYLNRSYCSSLFKERTGETFVNYLNMVRLTNAKQLLVNTEKKMYQIAKQVGYENPKYFFRIFKKYEHCTPEQYRKKYST